MNHMHNNHHEMGKKIDPALMRQFEKNKNRLFWLGIACIILGTLSIIFSTISTEIVVLYFGAFLILAGILEIFKAFSMNLWRGYFLLHLLLGALFVVGGIFMIMNPVVNALVLTLFWAWIFRFRWYVRIITALTHHVPHQGLMIVGGILNLILAF